jgi:heat shock protein HslJ
VLPGAVWRWSEFQSGDGTVVTASDPNQYSVEFLDDGTVRVQADCNTGFGPYTVDGSGVDLTVASTKVACPEGSQSTDFLRYLDDAVSYVIKDGRLWLSLMADAGIAVFDPAPPPSNEATPVAASGG